MSTAWEYSFSRYCILHTSIKLRCKFLINCSTETEMFSVYAGKCTKFEGAVANCSTHAAGRQAALLHRAVVLVILILWHTLTGSYTIVLTHFSDEMYAIFTKSMKTLLAIGCPSRDFYIQSTLMNKHSRI